jgi:hypothetical protein
MKIFRESFYITFAATRSRTEELMLDELGFTWVIDVVTWVSSGNGVILGFIRDLEWHPGVNEEAR